MTILATTIISIAAVAAVTLILMYALSGEDGQ